MEPYKIFINGYAVGCLTTVFINIAYHKYTIYKENKSLERLKKKELGESETIVENEKEKTVSPLTKTLIYKIHGEKKLNDEFYQSEFEKDNLDITLDGSKPNQNFLLKKREYLKLVSAVIFGIVFSFLLVFLRPDLFPFFKYSSVFSVFSKTFPENYLDMFKDPKPVSTITKSEENSNIPQPVSNHVNSSPSVIQNQNVSTKKTYTVEDYPELPSSNQDYWYIVELKNGENIITKNATEIDGIVSVIDSTYRERKFSRKDVKSVKKFAL